MAREVQISTWCDIHFRAGERIEGEEVVIAFGGRQKPRILALCDVHKKEIYDPLFEAVAELGQIQQQEKAGTPGKASGGSGTATAPATPVPYKMVDDKFACEYPGCDHESISTDGLIQHVRIYHDVVKTQYDKLVRGEVTIEDLGLEPYVKEEVPDPLPCGLGDCARVFKGDRRKGARSGHIVRAHRGAPLDWPPPADAGLF